MSFISLVSLYFHEQFHLFIKGQNPYDEGTQLIKLFLTRVAPVYDVTDCEVSCLLMVYENKKPSDGLMDSKFR